MEEVSALWAQSSRKFYGFKQFCNFCARNYRLVFEALLALHRKLKWKRFSDLNKGRPVTLLWICHYSKCTITHGNAQKHTHTNTLRQNTVTHCHTIQNAHINRRSLPTCLSSKRSLSTNIWSYDQPNIGTEVNSVSTNAGHLTENITPDKSV